jgi:hypothetical protein
MAWTWYDITQYKALIGGGPYYGGVQFLGPNFYGALTFQKSGALNAATAPVVGGVQRFCGHLDDQQIDAFVDILRNERPIRFGWDASTRVCSISCRARSRLGRVVVSFTPGRPSCLANRLAPDTASMTTTL